ncbi:hypothetical protein IWZ03DRAFT_367364 [Phyllosticta citriasiana]|uniref:Secreted protein n=1 Tax=Phyllosticta citriasiana TaxID=595635 RepID=A0ABR1L4P4_9PEZI
MRCRHHRHRRRRRRAVSVVVSFFRFPVLFGMRGVRDVISYIHTNKHTYTCVVGALFADGLRRWCSSLVPYRTVPPPWQ